MENSFEEDWHFIYRLTPEQERQQEENKILMEKVYNAFTNKSPKGIPDAASLQTLTLNRNSNPNVKMFIMMNGDKTNNEVLSYLDEPVIDQLISKAFDAVIEPGTSTFVGFPDKIFIGAVVNHRRTIPLTEEERAMLLKALEEIQKGNTVTEKELKAERDLRELDHEELKRLIEEIRAKNRKK